MAIAKQEISFFNEDKLFLRPKKGGRQFRPSSISSQTSLAGLENELFNPEVIRNTRNNEESEIF